MIFTKIQRRRAILHLSNSSSQKLFTLFVVLAACIINQIVVKILVHAKIIRTNNSSTNYDELDIIVQDISDVQKSSEKTISTHNIISISDLNPNSNPVMFSLIFKQNFESTMIDKFSIVFFSDIVKITYRKEDFNYTQLNNTAISFSIIVPITSYFNVTFCWENKIFKTLFHNISNVDNVPSDVSSLECFGRYDHRWCRAKHICWQNKRFIFFGLREAKINRTSMIPGSRPIPHDYPKCRVVVQYKMNEGKYPLPSNILKSIIKERSFLTCRWYSMEYLWHALFDYTLPLFWTTKLNGGSNSSSDRIFTIDENTSKKGYQFLGPFTNHTIENIKINLTKFNNTCFNDAIIGFPKSEYDINYDKWNNSPLLLPYEYPLEAFKGFREKMISYYSIPENIKNSTDFSIDNFMKNKCEPDPKHPRIVIAFRNSTMRDIVNQEELTNGAKKICPKCIVDPYVYGGESFGEQMLRYCNASILLSIHGSQLSHMVWMKIDDKKKPTAVIEIKPYKYICRDWYKQIADGAEIKYFQWTNPFIKNTKTGREKTNGFNMDRYNRCVQGKLSCLECHDYLRDQPTIVDMKSFSSVLKKAIKYVTNPK